MKTLNILTKVKIIEILENITELNNVSQMKNDIISENAAELRHNCWTMESYFIQYWDTFEIK